MENTQKCDLSKKQYIHPDILNLVVEGRMRGCRKIKTYFFWLKNLNLENFEEQLKQAEIFANEIIENRFKEVKSYYIEKRQFFYK